MFLSIPDSVLSSHIYSKVFCCDCNSLLYSYFDGIDVLDAFNPVLKCHIHYIVVDKLFLQSIKR